MFDKTPSVVKIGMWGPPGSGKTTYITMLNHDDCAGWTIKPRGRETQDLFLGYDEQLRDNLQFAGPTFVEAPTYLTFDFERPRGFLQKTQFRVIIPEAAGEYYENPSLHLELLEEMSRYQGIIWLVDPQRIDSQRIDNQRIDQPRSKQYRRTIQEWLFRLYEIEGGGKLRSYMAFCLTKMDLPKYVEHMDDPRTFCLDKLGEDVERLIEDFCNIDRVNFFSTSSIGCDSETGESNIDPADPTKLKHPAKPINLFKPFSWLFSVIK